MSKRIQSGNFKAESEQTLTPAFPGLSLVATPIGNLEDISRRALACLRSVDRIACEDTRVSRKLLQRFGINTPLLSYHEHNAEHVGEKILDLLRAGKSVALISDAGTPLISDPGYRLVDACAREGLTVSGMPGPSAPLLALTLSGLPTDRFLFSGFLPTKAGARKSVLEADRTSSATLIYLESPSRICRTLHETAEIFGARRAAVCRELTKMYEEVCRGTLQELAETFENREKIKGEIVLVIEGASAESAKWSESAVSQTLQTLLETTTFRDSVDETTRLCGWRRKDVYKLALSLGRTADQG